MSTPPCHNHQAPSPAALFRLLSAAALLTAGMNCAAAVRCIESVGQVLPMLDAALYSAETDEEVRIKSGNYLFTSAYSVGDFGYFAVLQGTGKTLRISGGWSGAPGLCTTQDGDASATVFWGLGQRKVFGIHASTTFSGTLVLENMLFGGGYSGSGSVASCLTLGEQNGGMMALRVDRIRVESCTSSSAAGPSASLVSSAGLILRNSLVAGNDAGTSPALRVTVNGAAGWVLNNTIADNVSANVDGFCGISASTSAGASLLLGNNLFDANVATAAPRRDIRLGTGVSLRNNRYTGLSGTPEENTGSSTGAAGFGDNDYELAETSPARDAGAYFAPLLQGAFDLYGRPRVSAGAVDQGALEYAALLRDGFE